MTFRLGLQFSNSVQGIQLSHLSSFSNCLCARFISACSPTEQPPLFLNTTNMPGWMCCVFGLCWVPVGCASKKCKRGNKHYVFKTSESKCCLCFYAQRFRLSVMCHVGLLFVKKKLESEGYHTNRRHDARQTEMRWKQTSSSLTSESDGKTHRWVFRI